MKKQVSVGLIAMTIISLSLSLFFVGKYIKNKLEDREQLKNQAINKAVVERAFRDLQSGSNNIPAIGLAITDEEKLEAYYHRAQARIILDKLNTEYGTSNIVAYLETEPDHAGDCQEDRIREIIAHSKEDNFYDRRNIRGQPDITGTVFLYHKNSSVRDPYANYFGHNAHNGTRLKKLSCHEQYLDCLKKIRLYSRDGIFRYSLVHLSSIDSGVYDQFPCWERDGFKDYYQRARELGQVHLQRENFDEKGIYMILNTCLDDYGVTKVVAIYKNEDLQRGDFGWG